MPASESAPEPSPDAAPANRLKTLALGERPQERLEKHGASALSDTELLAMLLRSGTRGMDVLTLASQLINTAGSLAGLIPWRVNDYRKLKGIGRVKALQLLTVMEVARRILAQSTHLPPILNNTDDVLNYMRPLVHGVTVEKLWVLCLNIRNRVLRCSELTSGTTTETLVQPREVYREAIREGATAIVVIHNHPSGDPSPSAADVRITRKLREAGATLEIILIDHVIIGTVAADPARVGYYSFRAAGLLQTSQ